MNINLKRILPHLILFYNEVGDRYYERKKQ